MSGQQDLSMKEASSVSTWKVAFTHLLLTRPKEQIYGYTLDMQGTTMAYIELKKSILRGYLFVLSALQAPPKVVQGLCSTTPRTVLKTRKQLRGHLCAHTHQALKSPSLFNISKKAQQDCLKCSPQKIPSSNWGSLEWQHHISAACCWTPIDSQDFSVVIMNMKFYYKISPEPSSHCDTS